MTDAAPDSGPWQLFQPATAAAPPPADAPVAAEAEGPWTLFQSPATPQVPPASDVTPSGAALEPGEHVISTGARPSAPSPGAQDDAPAPMPPAADVPSTSAPASFVAGAIGGVPIAGPYLLGGMERLSAAQRSLDNGTKYADELKTVQAADQTREQDHPIASAAGGMVGAGIALAPAIAAAPALFGAGAGPLTAGKIAMGAGSGVALGGTDAAVRSGADPGSVLLGAAGGALGGAAGPAIGAVASRLVQSGADAAAQAAALRNVGMSRPAAEIVTRAAEADGALGGQGAANIAAAGPQGMLADAGAGVANVLDTAMQRGGPGTVAARNAIEARATGANQDLNTALDTALGPAQGVQTATTAIRDGSAGARQAAYDAAYSTPIDYTSTPGRNLENMIQTRVPAGIIARANGQMRIDGNQSQQILARILPDGSVTFERMPDVRQIDYITRSLNDVARMGDGQGMLGGQTQEGRSYGNLARELRDSLRQTVPEYGRALNTAAEPIQARTALQFGSEMLRPSVHRDVVAEAVEHMTIPELQQVRAGLRAQISETLANVARTITDPNVDAREAMTLVKTLSSHAAQEKIGFIIRPAEHQALQTALTRATRALELRAAVATNSRTFGRTVTHEGVSRATEPGAVMKTVLADGPIKAMRPTKEFLTGNRPVDITHRQDAIYGELADVLTGPRGAEALGLLDRIVGAHNTRAGVNSFTRQIPYGGIAQTGILSALPAINERAK